MHLINLLHEACAHSNKERGGHHQQLQHVNGQQQNKALNFCKQWELHL